MGSQLLALALPAAALWLIKVKECARGKLAFVGRSGQEPVVEITLPLQYARGIRDGSLLFGDSDSGRFKARVLRQDYNAAVMKVRAVMLPAKDSIQLGPNRTGTLDVSISIRQRRALEVLLDRNARPFSS